MSSARRLVAANTAVQIAGKGVTLAIGLASIAIVTRYLGPDDYGRYTLALTYIQLFGVLADVGLFTIVVREISRRPERTERLVGNTQFFLEPHELRPAKATKTPATRKRAGR